VEEAGAKGFHDADRRAWRVGTRFRHIDARTEGIIDLFPRREGEGEHALVGEEDQEGIPDRGELVREVAFRFEAEATGDEAVQAVDPFKEGNGQGADGTGFQGGGGVEVGDLVLEFFGPAFLSREFGFAGGDQAVEIPEPGDTRFQAADGVLQGSFAGGEVSEPFPGGFQIRFRAGQGFPGGGGFGAGEFGSFDPFVGLFQLPGLGGEVFFGHLAFRQGAVEAGGDFPLPSLALGQEDLQFGFSGGETGFHGLEIVSPGEEMVPETSFAVPEPVFLPVRGVFEDGEPVPFGGHLAGQVGQGAAGFLDAGLDLVPLGLFAGDFLFQAGLGLLCFLAPGDPFRFPEFGQVPEFDEAVPRFFQVTAAERQFPAARLGVGAQSGPLFSVAILL